MTAPRRGTAPVGTGAGALQRASRTQGNSTSHGYNIGQRWAAKWQHDNANRGRESLHTELRIRALEREVAELRRIIRGEQVW